MTWRIIFIIIGFLCLTPLALAQTAETQNRRPGPPAEDNGWSLYLGGGGFSAPTYSGSDSHSVSVVPFIRLTKGDQFFASVQEGAGLAIIDDGGFRAGPLAQLDFGRDETGNSPFQVSGDNSDDLIGMGQIDFTILLGGFAEYEFAKDMSVKGKIGRAVSSHDGLKGQISLDYSPRIMGIGPPLFVNVGPALKFGDQRYMQAYYGVTSAQSAASGLTESRASGGIESLGMSGSVLMPLSYSAGLTIFGSYDRLLEDAADSPLVRERGSRNQLFGGAAIAYKF